MALAHTTLSQNISAYLTGDATPYALPVVAPNIGDMVVAIIKIMANGDTGQRGSDITIGDTAGNTWVPIVATGTVTTWSWGARAFYCIANATGATTISVNAGAHDKAYVVWQVSKFTGQHATPIGATATGYDADGDGAASATLSGAPAASSYVMGFVSSGALAGTVSATPGAGFAEVFDVGADGWLNFEVEQRTGSASTTVDWVDLADAGTPVESVLAAFEVVAASTGPVARRFRIQGQSEANGAGYVSDVTSGLPNQSIGYYGWYLRYPFLRPWTTGQTGIIAGHVRQNAGQEYEAQNAATCGATPPTHTSGDVSDGNVVWRWLRAAQPAVPLFVGGAGVDAGDVFRTTANRYYQVVVGGVLSATEPTSTALAGNTNGGARLRYIDTSTEARTLNRIYNGGVRVWHNTNGRFQNVSLITTGTTAANGNGQDADGVRIAIGPQIPLGALALNRWDDNNTFFIKHAVDGRQLAYDASIPNYSTQAYDAGGVNALLKNFDDATIASVLTLLGANVTAFAAGQTISTFGALRKNAGNVYQAMGTGTTGATAPTHTSGDVSDGTVIWRFVHPVYAEVHDYGLYQEHGAQDTNYTAWAYDYRHNELNLWRRTNHRSTFPTGGGVYVGYVEPFEPRNLTDVVGGAYKSAFAEVVRRGIKNALQDYAEAEAGGTVAPNDRTNDIAYGSRAAYIKRDSLYTSPYFPAASGDQLHSTCAGTEALAARWFAARDYVNPTPRVWGGAETTAFYGGGSRPVLTISTPPNETYAPGATVTATLANSGLNGGSASSIEWYLGSAPRVVIGTGLAVSFVPTKYNGQELHARYKDPNGYWAHWFGFFHVLAPRNALTDYCTANSVPIKQWKRGAIGAAGAAIGTIDNIANYTGASAGVYAVRAAGVTAAMRHHDGVAMEGADALRFNGATTDNSTNQQAAALVTAANADFTKFVKYTPRWKSSSVSSVYGGGRVASGSGIQGGGIYLEAAGGTYGDSTDFRVSLRYTDTLVTVNLAEAADYFSAGDTICAAVVKSGSTWTLYVRQPNGTVTAIPGGASVTTDANGYPDVLGYQVGGVIGVSGVLHEAVGIEHAIPSAGVVGDVLAQMAANDIPASITAARTDAGDTRAASLQVVSAAAASVTAARTDAGDTRAAAVLVPTSSVSGAQYVSVGTPATPPSSRLTSTPDIATGNGLAWGNIAGTGTVTVYADGTYVATGTVTSFDFQVWDGVEWGAVATQYTAAASIAAARTDAGDTRAASLQVVSPAAASVTAARTDAGDTRAASLQVVAAPTASVTASRTDAGDTRAASLQLVARVTASRTDAGDTRAAAIGAVPTSTVTASRTDAGDTRAASLQLVARVTAARTDAGDRTDAWLGLPPRVRRFIVTVPTHRFRVRA